MKKALALALVALPVSLFAEPPGAAPAAHIDVSKLPQQAKLIDDVVVPIPSEIFGVLDKLGPGKPNWMAVQHPITGVVQPTGEQPQIAFMLGAVIAEGFIAVEAHDSAQVKQIGKSVMNLSKALSVDAAVKKRAAAITDAADKSDWNEVRKELDGAMDDVKKAMVKMDSVALSQLVSLGGWIRGTEALTAVVTNAYTKDGAELLHQPVLLDYFDRRLAALKPKYKANPIVKEVQKGLVEIRPLIGLAEDVDISEKSVQEINRITKDLVNSINSKAP
jgi:phosphoglycolate phosphatase-like HAD superfamily hydrolase